MVSGFFYLRILKIAFGKKINSLLNIKFTYALKISCKSISFFFQVLSVYIVRQIFAYIEFLGKHWPEVKNKTKKTKENLKTKPPQNTKTTPSKQ